MDDNGTGFLSFIVFLTPDSQGTGHADKSNYTSLHPLTCHQKHYHHIISVCLQMITQLFFLQKDRIWHFDPSVQWHLFIKF